MHANPSASFAHAAAGADADILLYTTPQLANANLKYSSEKSSALPESITEYHRQASAERPDAIMLTPVLQSQFYSMLANMIGAKRVLEIGLYVGYSSMVWSDAVGPNGLVTALEIDKQYIKSAKEAFAARNINNVEVIEGAASESLPRLAANGSYDLVLIDADKAGYPNYLTQLLNLSKPESGERLLRPGAIIIADNVLRWGHIVDESLQTSYWTSKEAKELDLTRWIKFRIIAVALADWSIYMCDTVVSQALPKAAIMGTFSPNHLITTIIDTVAKREPNSVWLEWLTSEQKGVSRLRTITYGTLSEAVNKVAWLIHNNVKKRAGFETITYLGPIDAAYSIVLYACVKAGYKVLFTSPRNSLDAHLKLIAACDCKSLITPHPETDLAREIAEASGIDMVHLPSLEELCTATSSGISRPFPFSKTWSEAKHDPLVILHTSGTTGHPKPIVFTHAYFARCVTANDWPAPDGWQSLNRLFSPPRIISLMPLFHVAGVFHVTILPLYAQNITILPPPGAPPTSNTLVSILEHTSAVSAAISPATVDCLARNPDALAIVERKLQRLFYMGGVPTQALADLVAQRIELFSGIGSSECGPYVQLVPEAKDSSDNVWPYIRLSPYMNGRFEAQSSELFELVLLRNNPDEEQQPIFLLFPDKTEYRTKDVFSPHPTVPDLWSYRGRVDDIIVFSHGEKFNPVSFESQLCGYSSISGALMFGSGRFEAGLLIERMVAYGDEDDQASVSINKADEIWRAVQTANNSCPNYATVSRSHIIFTLPSKRMLRTGKGTVKRHATLDLYKDEIEQLYRKANSHAASNQGMEVPRDSDSLMQYLGQSMEMVTGKRLATIDTNFFETGMNSLQITRLIHHLRQCKGLDTLSSSLIYSHPTLALMAREILTILALEGADISRALPNGTFTFERAVGEYSKKIDELAQAPTETETLSKAQYRSGDPAKPIILLTGSTGGVGSYILQRLMCHPSQPYVYCLNRSADAKSRQSIQNKERDPTLSVSFPSDRVTFLYADLAAGLQMGLENDAFERLLASVSLVIHNAWPVDFTQPLSSFKQSLNGIVNLIGFCKHAKSSPRLLFVSSVAVAKSLKVSSVPEASIEDTIAAVSGYGESKLVAELMFKQAAQKYGIQIAAARVGQVAGAAATPGVWNARDWLPRLVRTSSQLRMIPNELGADNNVDWIAIDHVADILVELSLDMRAPSGFKVFHVVNRNRITWEDLLPAVIETLQESLPEGDKQIQVVSGRDWTKALRSAITGMTSGNGITEQKLPAIPLIDFFERVFHSPSQACNGRLKLPHPQVKP
ncbi:chitinase [Paramyrothecium foliicola]|nr:chitinase [Paramyrothecium foliicola]